MLMSDWTPAAPRRPVISRGRSQRVASGSSGNCGPPPEQQQTAAAQSSITDSDAAFLLKLAAVSFALGGAIKYGSLLIALPFEPNAGAALLFVLGPPLIWSAIKLAQSQQES
ncbi:hypothetical protein ABPG75_013100 [Micractinium tetrahymenae]